MQYIVLLFTMRARILIFLRYSSVAPMTRGTCALNHMEFGDGLRRQRTVHQQWVHVWHPYRIPAPELRLIRSRSSTNPCCCSVRPLRLACQTSSYTLASRSGTVCSTIILTSGSLFSPVFLIVHRRNIPYFEIVFFYCCFRNSTTSPIFIAVRSTH